MDFNLGVILVSASLKFFGYSLNIVLFVVGLSVLIWPVWGHLYAFKVANDFEDRFIAQFKPSLYLPLNQCETSTVSEESVCGELLSRDIQIPLINDISLEAVYSNGFALSFWVTPIAGQVGFNLNNIFWLGDTSDSFRPFASLWLNQIERNFHFSGADWGYFSLPNMVQPQKPLHITYVFSPPVGGEVYVNNYRLEEFAKSVPEHSGAAFKGSKLQLGIGRGFYPESSLLGTYSNVMIFHRALTEVEIRDLHQVPNFAASAFTLLPQNRHHRNLVLGAACILVALTGSMFLIRWIHPGFSFSVLFVQLKERDWIFLLLLLLGIILYFLIQFAKETV
ncbi:MAG: hypothetical protein A2600_12995 [Candidatus Lambdaproteobacteria bacterium RIFOXYD1_FULL_56_27]|nr:MAG: hypothetical protein A2600_12995 [Candidatus Lambdaproteobacteria bacterium RIFOXYD1_FULL_56_27]